MLKRRMIYCVLFLVTIPIGLATRKKPEWFYEPIAKYGGDILWTSLFFFLFRIIFPTKKLLTILCYTYAFAVSIEISQLYHANWIDDIRRTFLGKMILGFGFLWSDLMCYAIGALLGWVLATLIEKKSSI
ncbi:MAG: DUF2809 domain-containing protein [Chitinophagaceae bacterium]|nr:DUF2809 domain-containing protein [Chitinophagaceae bacterium]